jgi:MFS family permease
MASSVAPATPQRLSPDFWKFWTGQTISQLGSSFTQFATPLLIFKLTHSAVNLGIATAATFVPYLLFGLIIGAWVDRLNRKRLMIAVDLLRAGVIALIPLLSVLDVLEVWHIYLIGFMSSTLTIFFEASEFAAIPSLVGQDDLVTANGRIQASYSGAAVAGPLLAGLLLAVVKIETVFLVDALSFVVSAYSLGLVSVSFNKEQAEERQPSTIRSDVAEGLRYVLRHPVLRNISAMMALFNFVSVTTFTQLVLFAKERLDATDTMVGILFSAGSLGVVVLGLLAGRIRKHLKFGPAALGSLFVIGLLTVAFAVNHMYWLALVLWGLAQGLGIFFNINTGSLRQAIVPNHLLGRIISIAGVLAWSAIPLGSLLGGYAVHWTGNVALVYAGIGIISSAIAVWFFVFSPLGHAERYLPGGDLAAPEESAGVPLQELAGEPGPTFGEAGESHSPTHPAS